MFQEKKKMFFLESNEKILTDVLHRLKENKVNTKRV